MSATSDTLHPVTASTAPSRPTGPTNEIEILARRALGIAMNALYNGGNVAPLSVHDIPLVNGARALLERHVPEGPELTLALDLLDGAAGRTPAETASTTTSAAPV